MRFSLVKFQVHSRDKIDVRLPRKQVLDEMADKQKAVPEEADLVPLGDCFCCFVVISELENVVNL